MQASRRRVAAVLVAVGAVVGLVLALATNGGAAGTPANKAWVDGSTVEFMHSQLANGASQNPNGDEVVLARSQIRFSNPTDLRISVTSECALWTNTATTGDDDSEAKARVEMWVTIDGTTVPVSADDTAADNSSVDPDDPAGAGKVVFCNRAARMKTENIENVPNSVVPDSDTEDDVLIRSYNRTRDANAFNWGALNVGTNYDADGDNVLDVEVHARLAAELTDGDTSDNNGVDSPAALAAIGKRTLFIEPAHMAQSASF